MRGFGHLVTQFSLVPLDWGHLGRSRGAGTFWWVMVLEMGLTLGVEKRTENGDSLLLYTRELELGQDLRPKPLEPPTFEKGCEGCA
jgi:hypothetical protein